MSRYTVQGDYLCEYVDHCTCGMGRGGYYGAHEPGCGLEPVGPIAQLLAPQPTPSVPAGAEVAEVLRELIELQDSAASGFAFSGRYIKLRTRALEALATTGARAAGGELPAVSSEEVGRTAESSEPPSVGPPQSADRLTSHTGVGKAHLTGLGDAPRTVNEVDGELGGAVGVGEIPHDPSLAPPAPSAHGVAELLAECDRLDQHEPRDADAALTTDYIRRLLAPGGVDGDEG